MQTRQQPGLPQASSNLHYKDIAAMSSSIARGSEAEHAEAEGSNIEKTQAVEDAKNEVAKEQEIGAQRPYLGSSIITRSRARLKWANGTLEGNDASYWVCDKADCSRELCNRYRVYLSSRELLKKSIVDLEGSQQSLTDATTLADAATSLQEVVSANKDAMIAPLLANAVADKKTIMANECKAILSKHEMLKDILLYGCEAGNQTTYKTLQTNRTEVMEMAKSAAADQERERADVHAHTNFDLGTNNTRPPSPSQLQQCLNPNYDSHRIDDQDIKNNKVLKKFYNFCDLMFSKSIEVKHNYQTEQFRSCIAETCQYIIDWHEGTIVDDNKSYYRPSGNVQETEAVQPILFALIWKIARLTGSTTHLTKEQYPLEQPEKSKRWMDAMWCDKVNQHLVAAKGGLLGKSIEMKPLTRPDKSFAKMIDAGKN
jgi:hypothetical protein